MSELEVPPNDQPRISIPAAVSLVCGLLGWLVITAVVAIFAGIIGLKQTRNPNIRGRGMAMGGLILGSIFGVVGLGMGVLLYHSYSWGIQQVTTRLPTVLNAVSGSDTTSAQQYNGLTPAAQAALKEKTAGWGRVSAVTDLKLTGERVANQPDQMKLSGTANFDTAGPKPFVVTIMAKGDEVQVVDVVFNE
jgi:hypothetical protein